MAESYYEQNNQAMAHALASEAKSEAASSSDNELKVAIDELLEAAGNN